MRLQAIITLSVLSVLSPILPATATASGATASNSKSEQHDQLARQNAEMGQAALKVAQLVDSGQVAQLWEGASAVAKKAVDRESFVNHVTRERTQLGALRGRGGASITRVQYGPAAKVPEGLYVNVSFPSRFTNVAQPVRELVSFRLDEDRTWRLSGYSLRLPEQ